MNPAPRAVYVPPRPNLGPESARTGTTVPAWVMMAISGAFVLSMLLVRWSRRRARARQRAARAGTANESSAPAPATPRECVIAASQTIRQRMAERFGIAWNARTTEEIIADPVLVALLPPATLARLDWLLRLADRAKFAAVPDDDFDPAAYGEDWDALLAEVTALVGSDAGASSKING